MQTVIAPPTRRLPMLHFVTSISARMARLIALVGMLLPTALVAQTIAANPVW